jgi:hypothetical protein
MLLRDDAREEERKNYGTLVKAHAFAKGNSKAIASNFTHKQVRRATIAM